ncbi:Ca-activated chloride channel family protein [Bifidobacterium bohemicum]|uniref:von Willebrand factor, type A n=1 Tax=Bifidobacterium bohemicum DSM 22767 TaxID=1437606 RepID=A0A086ZFU4_9BIFI|nr:vWA domain-containing protein [Bifidobacterium bohemicum]KFI45394.1 von Willebrand factor, type A [Bifidobacterium bohemicum DSM 22767]SCB73937.1 Ca-activated chloride channel family protein [Bifidobacterium bohemicum]
MKTLRLSPALGWPAGMALAFVMTILAAAIVIVHIRRAQGVNGTDETLISCIRRSVCCLIIAVMALTPSVAEMTTSKAVNATDVVVATDVTGSMAVADAQYGSDTVITRIDAAKKAVNDLTEIYSGSSFAAVSFGAGGRLDVPLTPDIGAIRNWSQALVPEPTKVSSGSNLDAPLDALLRELKAIRTAHPQDTIVLYIITDGEQTARETRRTFSSLRQYLNDAFTIGVGSDKGGTIPESGAGTNAQDENTSNESKWVIDPSTGQPGISRMDKKNLTEIADEMGGKALIVNASETLKTSDLAKASKRWRVANGPRSRERVAPVVWPLAIVLVALLAWELGAWIVMDRRLL